VEILIGGDHYWKIVKDNPPIRISTSAVLVPTTFGWILSGNRSGSYVNSAAVNFANLDQTFPHTDDDHRRFWDLETTGISANHDRSLVPRIRNFLRNSEHFNLESQRRVVSLPKKLDTALPSNRFNAENRLNNLTKRLGNIETDLLRANIKLHHEGASESRPCRRSDGYRVLSSTPSREEIKARED
jgi:hypothetical protein